MLLIAAVTAGILSVKGNELTICVSKSTTLKVVGVLAKDVTKALAASLISFISSGISMLPELSKTRTISKPQVPPEGSGGFIISSVNVVTAEFVPSDAFRIYSPLIPFKS